MLVTAGDVEVPGVLGYRDTYWDIEMYVLGYWGVYTVLGYRIGMYKYLREARAGDDMCAGPALYTGVCVAVCVKR